MDREISLQTIDRVVRRGQEVSKLLSDNSIDQIFKDNQELIGYSSEILNSLERMNRDSIFNTVELASAVEKASTVVGQALETHSNKVQESIQKASSDVIGGLERASYNIIRGIESQTDILCSQIELSSQEIVDALNSIDCDIRYIQITMNEQKEIQQKTLKTLEELHETLKHPLLAESNELLERGSTWMAKGFLSDSANAFKDSIQKNPTNYLAHYYLGVLYLCGKNDSEGEDLIDLIKAEEEFKLALKYSKPDLDDDHVKQYVVLMHQSFSDLFYARALLGQSPEENYENAYQQLLLALSISNSIETQKCLNSRLLKCANKTGRNKEFEQYARIGYKNDYACLSYLYDPELVHKKEQLISAIGYAQNTILDEINASVTKNEINIDVLKKSP